MERVLTVAAWTVVLGAIVVVVVMFAVEVIAGNPVALAVLLGVVIAASAIYLIEKYA